LEIIVEETEIKEKTAWADPDADRLKVSMTRRCSPNWFVASQLANVVTA
jgi:hypothetical protein